MILHDLKEILPNGDLKKWDNLDTETMIIQIYEHGRLEEQRSAHDMQIMPLNVEWEEYWDANNFTKNEVLLNHEINNLTKLHILEEHIE